MLSRSIPITKCISDFRERHLVKNSTELREIMEVFAW